MRASISIFLYSISSALFISFKKPSQAVISNCIKDWPTSFNYNLNLYILFGVFNCHSISSRGTGSGVYNCILKQLITTCVLIGTSLDTLKAFLQLLYINILKNACLKAGRKPSLLIQQTCLRAKSCMHYKYFIFNSKKYTISSGYSICDKYTGI